MYVLNSKKAKLQLGFNGNWAGPDLKKSEIPLQVGFDGNWVTKSQSA